MNRAGQCECCGYPYRHESIPICHHCGYVRWPAALFAMAGGPLIGAATWWAGSRFLGQPYKQITVLLAAATALSGLGLTAYHVGMWAVSVRRLRRSGGRVWRSPTELSDSERLEGAVRARDVTTIRSIGKATTDSDLRTRAICAALDHALNGAKGDPYSALSRELRTWGEPDAHLVREPRLRKHIDAIISAHLDRARAHSTETEQRRRDDLARDPSSALAALLDSRPLPGRSLSTPMRRCGVGN